MDSEYPHHELVASVATCHQIYQQPVRISSAMTTLAKPKAIPRLPMISWISTEPDLSIASSFSNAPRARHTSLARSHENKACLISSAPLWQIGQLPVLDICLLAKITKHGIQPWRTRHAKILILLGTDNFQSCVHAEHKPIPPAIALLLPPPYLWFHWQW